MCPGWGTKLSLNLGGQELADGSGNWTGFSKPVDVWNVHQTSLIQAQLMDSTSTALTAQQSMIGNERVTRPPRIGFESHSFYGVLYYPVLRPPCCPQIHLFSKLAPSASSRSGLMLRPAGGSASNCILCLTIAHAIRASLFANAQATTFEGRRFINERTHSASGPLPFCALTITI